MIRISLVLAILGINFSTAIASEACKTLDAELVDQKTGAKGHMVFACHEGAAEIPDRNTLILFNWTDGALCTVVQECSNIRSWNVSVGIKAEFEYDVLLETIETFGI